MTEEGMSQPSPMGKQDIKSTTTDVSNNDNLYLNGMSLDNYFLQHLASPVKCIIVNHAQYFKLWKTLAGLLKRHAINADSSDHCTHLCQAPHANIFPFITKGTSKLRDHKP